MMTCKSLLYYSDHNIVIDDPDIYSWIRYLCGHGVSFYIILNRKENKAYKIVTSIDEAEKACHKLNKQLDCNDFIFDFIHNGEWDDRGKI